MISHEEDLDALFLLVVVNITVEALVESFVAGFVVVVLGDTLELELVGENGCGD